MSIRLDILFIRLETNASIRIAATLKGCNEIKLTHVQE